MWSVGLLPAGTNTNANTNSVNKIAINKPLSTSDKIRQETTILLITISEKRTRKYIYIYVMYMYMYKCKCMLEKEETEKKRGEEGGGNNLVYTNPRYLKGAILKTIGKI